MELRQRKGKNEHRSLGTGQVETLRTFLGVYFCSGKSEGFRTG